MPENIEIQSEAAGPDGPDQPIYEGFTESVDSSDNEQETQDQFDVPDKFILEDGSIDVESLAKSYSELERGISNTEEQPEDSVEDFIISDEQRQSYTAELQEHGELSEDSYDALEAQGLPRELVQHFIQGQQALEAQQQFMLLDGVGGPENYDQLTEWASENLSEQEVDAYDAVMNGGDIQQIQMAISGLHARHQQSSGRPVLIAGETGSSGAAASFRSWAEVTAAMKDPKYKVDPAYRNAIENRLAVSNLG